KQKGMWMGGNPPLGYDVVDRKLVINEPEAERVRDIFRRYAGLKSVRALKEELDADGIVGQVVRVNPLGAEAILISDPSHATPVELNRNGLRTVALGMGDVTRMDLPFLPNSADIRIGDLLTSSGLGDAFPAGYPVARVTRVERRPGESFARVEAEPTAALNRTRQVLLVWEGGEAEASPFVAPPPESGGAGPAEEGVQ
ncbi:MAG TPA: rod shape-determining protein MreC, partial [Gammaproteobacteria bacterium]|nr:rod shape-determining protein MreC [Gammaproteobacteria bacterium]